MSYLGLQYPDAAVLFSGNLTAIGVGSSINTTGYDGLVSQFTGNWSGVITFEGSNDGINWAPILVTKLSELVVKSQIEINGNWTVKCDTLYVRYNVTNITGTANLIIIGNNDVISTAVDRLSMAMDEANNSPLNIKLQPQNSGIKQDLSGAFVLSDAPNTVSVNQTATNAVTTIDTQGYQSIEITTQTFIGTITASNDGVTYSAIGGMTNAGTWVTSLSVANTNYIFPCQSRYIKIVGTTGGQFTYALRNVPFMGQNLSAIGGSAVSATTAQLGINLVNVGNTAVVTGGVAGTLGVGGTNAVGVASASNPVIVGGVDPTGLARRAATTMLGDVITGNRTIPTNLAALGTTTTGNAPIASASFNNQVPHTVQDTSQFEGQSQVELLAQLLQEVKILNQQMYELPKVLSLALQGPTAPQQGLNVQLGDDPFILRNDSSIFINQQ